MGSHSQSSSSSSSSPEARNPPPQNISKTRLAIAIGVCVGVVVLLGVLGAIAYAGFRPQKPSFTLDDVTVSTIGGSSSSPSLMVTFTALNPSQAKLNVGILGVYMSVGDTRTEAATADGMFQEPKETATWTVILGINGDMAMKGQGQKGLVVVEGKMQWKIGFMYTPMSKFKVKCPVIFNSKPMGVVADSRCSIH